MYRNRGSPALLAPSWRFREVVEAYETDVDQKRLPEMTVRKRDHNNCIPKINPMGVFG